MGRRKIVVKQSAADSIASIAWFIESKGLLVTAEKFADSIYDFFLKIADDRKSYAICGDPARALVGYKCITYKKKYTIVFIETEKEIVICEFILSKLIIW